MKTIAQVATGILLAVGVFLYARMEVRDHKALVQVVNYLNQAIAASQPQHAQAPAPAAEVK